MQTHDLVNYAEKLSQATQKGIKKKATQSLHTQIEAMSLQLQLTAKYSFWSPQGKPPFQGVYN